MSLGMGQRLGAYEIIAPLGAGGMGEVYRARDTRLRREVAIKVLPDAFTSDPERLARFEHEAHVLAALNHPHIGSIYGFEEADGLRSLVLELVEGPTLADRLASGPLPVTEALTIARDIADALEAAHEKGIIHRDLKPANIKITHDGNVKVLDFGLAKVYADEAWGRDLSQSPTVSVGTTREGLILGTAAYMSPEQARGRTVDKRTDIWAFGCVLYELLAGPAPFAGDTLSDTIVRILEREPDWRLLPPATPETIRRLIRRCLEKNVKRRFRDIGDARLEIDEALAGPTAALPPQVVDRRRERVAWGVAGGALLVALGTLVALGWSVRSQTSEGAPRFSRIVRVTSGPAREFGPAISPDGKWVAYLSNAGGPMNVWVKFIGGSEPANLTASAGLEIGASTAINGLEISPDGTRIAVMARLRGSSGVFSTWEIPAPLPGSPRKLLDDGFVGMRWSPSGKQITFIRAGASAGDALWVADADGTNRREIIKARGGLHIHWPAWAPDGSIHFIRALTTGPNWETAEIYRTDASGGTIEPVVVTSRRAMFPLPMPNGNGLIYAANPTAADMNLWWRSRSGGEPLRLTTGVGEYAEPRISADGRTLVCTVYDRRQSLNRIRVTAPAAETTALTDGYGGDLDPSLPLAGDRLIFSSSRSGERHVWTAALDGSNARPLTSGGSLDDRPSVSPDGQHIVFVSDRSGKPAIWIMSADGGTPRKLTDVPPLSGLSWSSDSQYVVYAASAGDWPGLSTASGADGQIRRISTPGAAGEPAWCPKRDVIAYMSVSTSGPSFTRLAFVDVTGKPLYTTLPPPPGLSGGFANGMAAWAPDGRRLAVIAQQTNSPTSVWIVDPDASVPYSKLIELPVGVRIRGISWTRDGSALIAGVHDMISDIALLSQTP